MKIAILGFGSFGIAIAKLLHQNGHQVSAYARNPEKVALIRKTRQHAEYMPNIILHEGINITSNIEEALNGAGTVVVAVVSSAVRGIVNLAKPYLKKETVIINAAKGLEDKSLMRMSQVIADVAPSYKTAILSGPCHAEEIAAEMPSTCVAASVDDEVAAFTRDIFFNNYFRVYTNNDVLGVELGGALKNVIALAAGVSDGLGYGDNAKAAIMTRGISEISRLGIAMGANEKTFSGLTGIGDLIVTCTSIHSRNRRAGILLGKGKKLPEVLEEIHMVVEGAHTAKAAFELSKKYNVEMPIVEEINKALFENKNIRQVVAGLMCRDKKGE